MKQIVGGVLIGLCSLSCCLANSEVSGFEQEPSIEQVFTQYHFYIATNAVAIKLV